MVISPKETFITSTADISKNATTSITIKENNEEKLFTPFAITEITTLYAWKNSSDAIIYTVDESTEESTIVIYIPSATGLSADSGTFEDGKIGFDGAYYERSEDDDVDVSAN